MVMTLYTRVDYTYISPKCPLERTHGSCGHSKNSDLLDSQRGCSSGYAQSKGNFLKSFLKGAYMVSDASIKRIFGTTVQTTRNIKEGSRFD
jgi:hypothetical protein